MPHEQAWKPPTPRPFAAVGSGRSRYTGQAKTHLQHLLTATALNLLRLGNWLTGTPLAPTRESAFTRFMAQAA